MINLESIYLFGLFFWASGVSVHFQDCGSVGSYMVDEVVLGLSCESQPCWLPLKMKTKASVSFRSTDVVALDVTTQVDLLVANMKKKLQVTPVTCPTDLCPIGQQEKKLYTVEINPDFHSEPLKVDVFWEAFNQKGDQLFCVTFPVVVYNPETHFPTANFLAY